MSYAMTHLIIADRTAKKQNIKNRNLFLLAGISPDAVHNRDDFSFRLKADAHDMQPDEKWGEIYTDESMLKWYGRVNEFYKSKLALVTNDREKDYLLGYIQHIMVDIYNCKLLYAPQLLKYDFKVELMREEYRRECILQDNYLYQNYESSKEIADLLIETSKREEEVQAILNRLELDTFISAKNLIDNVNYHTSGYRKAEKASLDNLEMVSVESSHMFLDTVEAQTNRIVFSGKEEPLFE